MTQTAINPAFQPVVDMIYDYLEREGITTAQLAERIYGRSPDGKVKGAQLYMFMKGGMAPGEVAIEKIRRATGLSLPYIERPPRKGTAPARAALKAYAAATKPDPEPVPPSSWGKPRPIADGPPRFAMTIDSRGRASLTLNLIDVPAEAAMQVYAALQAAGLIGPG